MTDMATLAAALEPVLSVVRTVDPSDSHAAEALAAALPVEGETLVSLRRVVREGVVAGWLAQRENGGIRFGRVHKSEGPGDLGIECVHMDKAGPGHTHPAGEINLCFAVSGEPTFDGASPGWIAYPPGSWHVPTVAGGVMDILYFLPGGAIRFESKPA